MELSGVFGLLLLGCVVSSPKSETCALPDGRRVPTSENFYVFHDLEGGSSIGTQSRDGGCPEGDRCAVLVGYTYVYGRCE